MASPDRSADLGRNFGADLYEAEVRYLFEHEWAMTAEDVLWRRTKRGLQLSREEAAALDEYMRGTKPGLPCRGCRIASCRKPGRRQQCWN